MPNRPLHLATSGPAGAAFAYYKASNDREIQLAMETIGGALGGLLGGILPDILDPPLHPGHRAFAHGLLPVGVGTAAWAHALDSWQKNLRDQANEYTRLQFQAAEPLLKAWYAASAMALRVLSGMLAGFVAGYLTHIALDFTTPRCLPLIS